MTFRGRAAQATTEYLVLLSVLATALIVAAWAFYPAYREGLVGLNVDGTRLLDAGTQDGHADMR
jgi:hypothetical protein